MRGTASARAIARLLTVCAALTGLFFMHGLPAQACSGGTGGMSTMTMTATPTVGHSDGTALAAVSAHRKIMGTFAAAAKHGTACVFTPAPRGIGVLLALLLAAIAALASSPRLPNVLGRRNLISRRAPPLTGAGLLTALCVSRT